MSEKPIISRVVVLYSSGCETYQVGSERINCIKDISIELESQLHNIYEVYKDGKLFCRIENCSVAVEFYQSNEVTNAPEEGKMVLCWNGDDRPKEPAIRRSSGVLCDGKLSVYDYVTPKGAQFGVSTAKHWEEI